MLFTLSIIAVCGLLAYAGWRITRIKKNPDTKHHIAFWAWPVAWFLVMNLTPSWRLGTVMFTVLLAAMLLCVCLDFFYFYGLKAKKAGHRQWLSLLLLIPCLIVAFRHTAAGGPIIAVPYFGKALIWTDSPIAPKTFFFMDPASRSQKPDQEAYDDPNFGKAVFSPVNGVIEEVGDDGYLLIRDTQSSLLLSLGPMLPESVNLGPGNQVITNIPLGLLDTDKENRTPGLRLRIVEGGPIRFGDVLTGRYLVSPSEGTVLRRNHYALNQSLTRDSGWGR
jgi:uncharacterized membrane protein YdcZ (DUF606 family)